VFPDRWYPSSQEYTALVPRSNGAVGSDSKDMSPFRGSARSGQPEAAFV